MWNVKFPSPDEAVDSSEAVDIPSMRRLGGGVKGGNEDSCASRVPGCCEAVREDDGTGGGVGTLDWIVGLEACWYRGERGGDRTGREAIGEGGTKGKDSRIESARVEVVDTTEVPDTLLAFSRP